MPGPGYQPQNDDEKPVEQISQLCSHSQPQPGAECQLTYRPIDEPSPHQSLSNQHADV